MSWQTINEILGLAATDEHFARELVTHPLETMRRHGYQLTVQEREAFRLSASQTLETFSQNLLLHLSQATPLSTRKRESQENE